jgi:hypothetical protein
VIYLTFLKLRNATYNNGVYAQLVAEYSHCVLINRILLVDLGLLWEFHRGTMAASKCFIHVFIRLFLHKLVHPFLSSFEKKENKSLLVLGFESKKKRMLTSNHALFLLEAKRSRGISTSDLAKGNSPKNFSCLNRSPNPFPNLRPRLRNTNII